MTTATSPAPAITYTIAGPDPLRFDLERFSHRQVLDETSGGEGPCR